MNILLFILKWSSREWWKTTAKYPVLRTLFRSGLPEKSGKWDLNAFLPLGSTQETPYHSCFLSYLVKNADIPSFINHSFPKVYGSSFEKQLQKSSIPWGYEQSFYFHLNYCFSVHQDEKSLLLVDPKPSPKLYRLNNQQQHSSSVNAKSWLKPRSSNYRPAWFSSLALDTLILTPSLSFCMELQLSPTQSRSVAVYLVFQITCDVFRVLGDQITFRLPCFCWKPPLMF